MPLPTSPPETAEIYAMRSYPFTLALNDNQPLPEGTIVTLNGNFDDPAKPDEREYGASSSDRLRYEVSVDHLMVGATYHYRWHVRLPDGREFTLPPDRNDHYTIIIPPLEQQLVTTDAATPPAPAAATPAPTTLPLPQSPAQPQPQQTLPAPAASVPVPVISATPPAPEPIDPPPAPEATETTPEAQHSVSILRRFMRWRYLALLAAIVGGSYVIYRYTQKEPAAIAAPLTPQIPVCPESFEPENEISVSGTVARVHDQLIITLQPVAIHGSDRLYAAIVHPTRLTEFHSDLQTQPLIRVTNERGECFVYLGGLVGAMSDKPESFDIKAQLQRGMYCK